MSTPSPLDKPSAIKRLQQLHAARQDLSTTAMLARDQRFIGRLRALFGNYRQALLAAGIAPEKVTRLRRYSKQDVLARLKARRDKGEELSFAALMRDDPKLYALTRAKFGSYAKAMAQLGLDINDVRRLPRWSKRSIITGLRQLQRSGLAMRFRTVEEKSGGLAIAATRHFGSWEQALQAAHLKSPPRKTPWRSRPVYWTNERVIATLQKRHKKGQAINPAGLVREARDLYYGACRRFGTFPAALAAAGIQVPQLVFSTEWNQEDVLAALRKLADAGTPLTHTALKTPEHNRVLVAARRLFGSFQAAVEAAGVVYPAPGHRIHRWTRPTVLAVLQRMAADDPESLKARRLGRRHQGLYRAALKFFGGNYGQALQAAGITKVSYDRRALRWTPQAMIEYLQARHQKGQDLRPSVVAREEGALPTAARRHWGSYDEALVAAGVPAPALKPLANLPWPEVVRQIQTLAQAKEDLRYQSARYRQQPLFHAARYYFGVWHKAVTAAGLDYSNIVKAGLVADHRRKPQA